MTQEILNCLGSTGFYDKRGEDAVLLIHGLTGTPAEMRYIAKNLLKQGFSVACPQLAGHCESPEFYCTTRAWMSDVRPAKRLCRFGMHER